MSESILLGAVENKVGEQVRMNLATANRHGLITGATGTGKTVTLQVMAEQFARAGVPVFTADVKGDLAGLSVSGKPHEKIDERMNHIKISDYSQEGSPVMFWDIFGEKGTPIRTTISEMGPLLLSRLLRLNDTQDAVLHMIFKMADDEGLLLDDLKDFQALLLWVGENIKELKKNYGNISTASLGAIQRSILVLEEAGGDLFFGEKALDLNHLLQKDFSGRGVINILDAQKLIHDGRIYSTFILWLISELFENLPEVGDQDKPKMVFFFDEAHLLFRDAPKVLVEKVEQAVRLIRSKGVGIYFVTQNPLDIPETVRAQLGNRVQHALRAFTPKDMKAVKAMADSLRPNPDFDTEEAITNLGTGVGLVSTLDEKGRPSVVERVLICPPRSKMGPIEDSVRQEKVLSSPLHGIYEKVLDRESAHEVLAARVENAVENQTPSNSLLSGGENQKGYFEDYKNREGKNPKNSKSKKSILDKFDTGKRQGYLETMTKQVLRSVSSKVANKIAGEIIRGVLGGILK